ncbi:hypothetical protein AB0J14_03370 [Micromonospora arborensis]|uniref:hypothetical protein n=1 Tax=Micromonospora arborensis TaxID=2116518 RepID=UPI00340E7003
MPHWSETARVAEERGDWDRAIAVVGAAAECYRTDYERHNAHLWHMDLLARAGRHVELAALGQRDVHARRRLNRLLYEEGRSEELRQRARSGDGGARYLIGRLVGDWNGSSAEEMGD